MTPSFWTRIVKKLGQGMGAMTKKRAKGKAGAKADGKQNAAEKDRQPDPAGVRKRLELTIEDNADKMVSKLVGRANDGELPTVKYLLELASIFPPSKDGLLGSKDEESFAESLMRRLDLPDKPEMRDEDENVAAPELKGEGEDNGAAVVVDAGSDSESDGAGSD